MRSHDPGTCYILDDFCLKKGKFGNTPQKQALEVGVDMPKKKQEPFDPNNLKPEDRMKFEIASELGLADKVIAGGWKSLTSKESGKIGGMVTKRKRELKKQ